VVPCGVDTERFSPEGPAAERNGRPRLLAAQALTAEPSTTEQLTTGRGLEIAVRALAEIPDAELVITGGPHRAGRDLRRLARQLGVGDRLVFTGPVPAGDLPALYRSADLLVGSAPYEPVAMTAIQAMACGTPVVAATAGAERDAVIDAITGLLAPPQQPRQLARRIRRLLANSMQLEAYGIAAADRARSRYSWERIGRETRPGECRRGRPRSALGPAGSP
jgi:glycosyltransferase involved in cell wall biosynthesis